MCDCVCDNYCQSYYIINLHYTVSDLSSVTSIFGSTDDRVPTVLLTKNPGLCQDHHEKFSRSFSEPTNA